MNVITLKGRGLENMGYYISFSGEKMARSNISDMKRVVLSKKTDISYNGFIGNTLDSHRLIWKAMDEGRLDLQDRVVESVFKAYFEEEKSLGEPSVLKECAERAGMDVSSVLRDGTDAGRREVEEEMEDFRTRFSCSGVPLFVVDGTYVLSGAQPPEAFLETFSKLR